MVEKQKTRLSIKQKESLDYLVGLPLKKVIYHYWGHKNNPQFSLDWIQLIFEKKSICFTAGSIAENIETVNFDLKSEKERLNKIYDGEVIITTIDNSKSDIWKSVISKKVKEYKILDHEGY